MLSRGPARTRGLAFRSFVPLAGVALLASSASCADVPSLVFEAAVIAHGPTPIKGVVGDFKANTLLVADIDGDGPPDAITANSFDDTLTIYRGIGDGTFAVLCTASVARRPVGLAAGDWNLDGRLDLAVTSYNRQGVSALLNDGRGCLRQTSFVAGGHSPQALAVGDWNGDGRADFAISNRNDHNVSIALGMNGGDFRPASQKSLVAVGRFPSGIVTGDWNMDGRRDLAVVNHFGHSISILVGDGEGQFAVRSTIGIGLFPGDIDTADLNGDGKPDLVAANVRNNDLSVLFGRGDGTFASVARLRTGRAPAGVAAGDFDGDGRIDIAVAMRDAAEVMVFRNETDGAAAFQAQPVLIRTQDKPIDVAIADLDRDGRQDLVVYLPAMPAVQTLLNRTSRRAAVRGATD